MDTLEKFTNIDEVKLYFLDNYSKRSITKKFIDFELEKFGDFTLKQLTTEYKAKKHKTVITDIQPSLIIGTSHHPNTLHTFDYLLNDNYIDKIISENISNKFENKWSFESSDLMSFYSFNNLDGERYYIVRQGHHRSVLGFFLELLDENYKLRNVRVTNFYIDWDRINIKNNRKILRLFIKNNFISELKRKYDSDTELISKLNEMTNKVLYFNYEKFNKSILIP